MASNQVAMTLTIAYWIASVPFGATLVNYSAPWIWIGWVLAVLFFVIPLTAILWFIALFDRFANSISPGSTSRSLERSCPRFMPGASWFEALEIMALESFRTINCLDLRRRDPQSFYHVSKEKTDDRSCWKNLCVLLVHTHRLATNPRIAAEPVRSFDAPPIENPF
jgi:hypothetical protein